MEDVVSRKYLLIDTWDVRHQHLLIFSFSIFMFVIYFAFMWVLCSLTPSITTALLLLGSQICIGLPATRAYYEFGVSTRRKLKFFDAGTLGADVETKDLRIATGQIPLLFERFEYLIRKYDSGALDDLNDLAWFAIIIWAVISSAGIFTTITGISICLLGSFVLIITCIVSYISGYRTVQGFSFEEDLHHLEYYIDRSIKKIDMVIPKENGKVILQVTKRPERTVLIDIIVEFNLANNSIIEYHLGLSTQRKERFIILLPSAFVDDAYANIKKIPSVKDSTWTIEQITTQSGRILHIVNSDSRLCICDRSTFVINPGAVEQYTQPACDTLKSITSILKSNLDMKIE